jgi:hypothetical protein
MNKEKRKPIPGYPGYEMDTLGNIYSVRHWHDVRKMTPYVTYANTMGPFVMLVKDGRKKRAYILDLIFATFPNATSEDFYEWKDPNIVRSGKVHIWRD